MKLQLIPTLQYMDASQAMTLKAKAICENLLDNYVSGIPQQVSDIAIYRATRCTW